MTRLRLLTGFVKALLRAAPHMKEFPSISGLAKAAWIALGFGRQVQATLEQRRLSACKSCTNFNRKTATCGTPPSAYGCWCYMPVKAMLPEANCWLYETNPGHPDHMGWPKELNGDNLCQT
jgi:hypothetical protein